MEEGSTAHLEKRGREVGMGGGSGLRRAVLVSTAWQHSGVWVLKSSQPMFSMLNRPFYTGIDQNLWVQVQVCFLKWKAWRLCYRATAYRFPIFRQVRGQKPLGVNPCRNPYSIAGWKYKRTQLISCILVVTWRSLLHQRKRILFILKFTPEQLTARINHEIKFGKISMTH